MIMCCVVLLNFFGQIPMSVKIQTKISVRRFVLIHRGVIIVLAQMDTMVMVEKMGAVVLQRILNSQ